MKKSIIGEVFMLEDGSIVVKMGRNFEPEAEILASLSGRLICFDGYDNAVIFSPSSEE